MEFFSDFLVGFDLRTASKKTALWYFPLSSGIGKSRGERSGTLTYVALRNKYSVLDFALLIFLACCAIMGQSLFRAATLHPLRDEEMTVHELWNMPSTED